MSSHVPAEAPHLTEAERRSPVGIAIGAAVFAGLVLLVASLSRTPPESSPPITEPAFTLQREDAPTTTETDVARQEALALAIDSFDRITYTTASPPLDSIHRGNEAWYSIDAGLLYRSNDLISWIVTSDLWQLRALSLDSTSGETLALLETEQQLIVQRLDGEEPVSVTQLSGEAIMGALRYPDWAVVEVDADGYWLTTGNAGERVDRTPLATLPTGLAINDGFVLVSFADSANTTLLSRPTNTAADNADNAEAWCVTTTHAGVLTTTGDGIVHVVGETVVSTVDGALVLSMVDSTLLAPGTQSSATPLATGGGWSVTTGIGSGRPTVWTSQNANSFERIEVPRSNGQPVRVVWAYLNASEGLGVKVSDVALTNGLLRVGDPRTRHPRPQDLDRSVTVSHTPWKVALREGSVLCDADLLSQAGTNA